MKLPPKHDEPVPEQGARRHATARPRHDDEGIAGEQLRAADDDQDQSEAERDAGQHPHGAPRRRARPRQGRRGEHAAERDEGAGQHGERERGERIHRHLAGPDLLGAPGHLAGQQRVEVRQRSRLRSPSSSRAPDLGDLQHRHRPEHARPAGSASRAPSSGHGPEEPAPAARTDTAIHCRPTRAPTASQVRRLGGSRHQPSRSERQLIAWSGWIRTSATKAMVVARGPGPSCHTTQR